MTDDTQILALLRAAVPPVVATSPSPDIWLRVVERSRGRKQWSWVDLALTAAIAIALVARPDLLLLLAYHF